VEFSSWACVLHGRALMGLELLSRAIIITLGSSLLLLLLVMMANNIIVISIIISDLIITQNWRDWTPWPESAIELYGPSDLCLSAKLVPTFVYRAVPRGQRDGPLGRILGFLDRSRYFVFQVAPQLYSRGRVNPFPDPLILRKSGTSGNRNRTSASVARNSDY
jgi:hypothetical protein